MTTFGTTASGPGNPEMMGHPVQMRLVHTTTRFIPERVRSSQPSKRETEEALLPRWYRGHSLVPRRANGEPAAVRRVRFA